MSESIEHMALVDIAVKYIQSIVPPQFHGLIAADTPQSRKVTKVCNGFVPDVFFWHDDIMIIGEAKTALDFERKHSQAQFEAFLQECSSFKGKAVLVISVPWELVATAKNFFRRKKRASRCKTKIIIINQLGRTFSI